MIDPIRRLLTEAGNAKQTRAFWQAVTGILSDWVGGARVHLVYKGLNESGTVQAGATAKGGERFIADYHDAEGRHVQATFQGLPDGFPSEALRSAVEIATHLDVMVARRAGLERERRLGTFLVELSRWLLAAPERELLLRYTLQSVMSLVEAQGAFVALRQREGDTLRIAATVGQSAELQGRELGLTTSTTGAVVRSGEPLLTDNIRAEPDAQPVFDPAGTARGAMIAPLKTSSGVAGAVGVIRYEQAGAETAAPPAFGLVDLQYLAAVAAYIAGGLEPAAARAGGPAGPRAAAQPGRVPAVRDRDRVAGAGHPPRGAGAVAQRDLAPPGPRPAAGWRAVARARARHPAGGGSPHLRLHHHWAVRGGARQPARGPLRPDRRAAGPARADRTREAGHRRRDRERRGARSQQPPRRHPHGGGAARPGQQGSRHQHHGDDHHARGGPRCTHRAQPAAAGAARRHDAHARADQRPGARRRRDPAARVAGGQRAVPHAARPVRAAGPGPGARAAAGGHQPRHQRRTRGEGARPRGHSAHDAGARGVGAARRRRLGARHPGRDPRPDLRSVLHDQGAGRGHRPRSRDLPAGRD